MTRLMTLFCAALLAVPLTAAVEVSDVIAVFAAHDPSGRLPNTDVQELGELHVQEVTFSVYYLTFVNPVSRHGQHRVAIIRNGSEFVGAYQCWLKEGGARLAIGEDSLTVYEGEQTFVIRFDSRGPIDRESAFCGESTGWENSI